MQITTHYSRADYHNPQSAQHSIQSVENGQENASNNLVKDVF